MAAAEVFTPLPNFDPSVGWKANPPCEVSLMQEGEHPVLSDKFDPNRYLNYTPPSKVHSMKELGFDHGIGVSPVAVSEPFPLFTEEAVMKFREEVLNEEVMSQFKISSNLSHCQLRGFAHKHVYQTLSQQVSRLIRHTDVLPLSTTPGRTQRSCVLFQRLQDLNWSLPWTLIYRTSIYPQVAQRMWTRRRFALILTTKMTTRVLLLDGILTAILLSAL